MSSNPSPKRSNRSGESLLDGPYYATPAAFKQALEQRLRSSTKTGAEFARKRLREALERTFSFRKTHPLPTAPPDPPPEWAASYVAMAREDGLAWATLDDVAGAAHRFLDPVLVGDIEADWDPTTWSWVARPLHEG